MALPTPLGNFARSRRDLSVETLRMGSQFTNGQDDNLSDNYFLNNNATDGSSIAVWGVLAYYYGREHLMMAGVRNQLNGTQPPTDFQIYPSAAMVPGYTSFLHDTSPLHVQLGVYFITDGITWLQNGDVPLAILPVGYSYIVSTWANYGLLPFVAPSFCSFVWGPYSTARFRRS